MSIVSEITRLQNAKAALKSSIEAKGVTVDPSATLDSYPELVDSIPTGGGKYEPICFTSLEDGNTFKLNRKIAISVDDKQTWQTLNANANSPAINTGEKIYFRATEDAIPFEGSTSTYYKFTTAKTCNVSGHPYSLLAEGSFYLFPYLFNGTKIVDASELDLSKDSLSAYCYEYMFKGCTSLTTAPELPATILANNCYLYMFDGCTSLTTAPSILPATILVNNCYSHMFNGCTSLTAAPELPATTLANYCYTYMFKGCTSLTAPELPATTLAENCYEYMFSGCTSLTTAPELPATTLVRNCYIHMFSGCTSLTTAPELPATTLAVNCYSNMFDGCTSLVTAPELPVTTLVYGCYNYMFNGCTSLTAAPELPATILVNNCYTYMFKGCTSLNYIKCLATNTSSSYTEDWVYGVAATGTFTKDANTTWPSGANGIPTAWTVETNA